MKLFQDSFIKRYYLHPHNFRQKRICCDEDRYLFFGFLFLSARKANAVAPMPISERTTAPEIIIPFFMTSVFGVFNSFFIPENIRYLSGYATGVGLLVIEPFFEDLHILIVEFEVRRLAFF
jgi:hypothetical protein